MAGVLRDITDIFIENNLFAENEVNESNYESAYKNIAELIDSILYMTLLVSIEEKYGIELSDEILNENVFADIKKFIANVEKLKNHVTL